MNCIVGVDPWLINEPVLSYTQTHNHAKNGTERKYFLTYLSQNLANKGISSNTISIYIENSSNKPHRFYSRIIRIWDAQNLMRPGVPELEYHQFFLLKKEGHFYKMLGINLVCLDYKMIWFYETTASQHHMKSKRPDIRFNEVRMKKNHTIITISQYKMALNSPFHLWLYLNSKPEGTIRFWNVEKITLLRFIMGTIKCFSILPDWKRMTNHCKSQHPKIIW